MPYDFNIYHSQVTPTIPDYDTVSVLTSADLFGYATEPYVAEYGRSNFLSLLGGALSGDLILDNLGGIAKSLILKSAEGIPISIRSGLTFVGSLYSETGIIIPGLLITDGRLDITPDPIFNRAEFRIRGGDTQFNIYNINTFEYYMRVNSDTSFMTGVNTVAVSAGAFATGTGASAINTGCFAAGGTTLADGPYSFAEGELTRSSGRASHAEGRDCYAINFASHAEGFDTKASGIYSHSEGLGTIAAGNTSHAAGYRCIAAHDRSWIWKGSASETAYLSTARLGQFLVSAEGGITLHNRVGIGTNSNANALTVIGDISATRTVFSSGAPVIVSTSTFQTPTTGISAVNNIIAMSQATYDALTIKLPGTFYIIV